jgi:Dolichyl-phosphate-mannose-protein mannosyltransferase
MKSKPKRSKAMQTRLLAVASGQGRRFSVSVPSLSVTLQFVLLYVGLVVLHFSTLMDPVYWDTIIGSFHQAIWLKDNHLNQYELCRTMPASFFGGPKVYTISLYPLVQAVLMKILPNIPTLLLLNHLAEMAMSAGTVVILHAILRRVLNPWNAILVAGIWLSFPMFHTMVATINMDLPASFFTLLAVLLFIKNQRGWMVVALIVGVLTKQSVAVAIIAIMILTIVRIANRSQLKWSLLLVFPLVLACSNPIVGLIEPKELCGSESTMIVSDWLFHPSVIFDRIKVLFTFVPDQTVYLLAAFLGSIVYGFVSLFGLVKEGLKKVPNRIAHLQSYLGERELPLLCAAMIIGFTLLYYAISIILPRYTIWVMPYELILFAFLLRKTPKILATASIIVIAVNVVNHSGYLYRVVGPNNLQGYAMYLERSMEYRDDLICNQKMAEFAEKNLQECDILTCWPFTHKLAAPEFGYVKKPLSVVSINGLGLVALGVPHISTWQADPTRKPKPYVFISTYSNYFMPILFDPQKHRLIHQIVYKHRTIEIFQQK